MGYIEPLTEAGARAAEVLTEGVAYRAQPCVVVGSVPAWIMPNGKVRVGAPNAEAQTAEEAAAALRAALLPRAEVVEFEPREGRDFVPGQVTVRMGGREFAVIDGRRWTKVPEYLSNGQFTARFFVDEKTGEVRQADGWRKPKGWPLPADAAKYVLAIVEAARRA